MIMFSLMVPVAGAASFRSEYDRDRNNGWKVTEIYKAGTKDQGYAAVKATAGAKFLKKTLTAQGKCNSEDTANIARSCSGYAIFDYNGALVTEYHLYEPIWTASQSYTSVFATGKKVTVKGRLGNVINANLYQALTAYVTADAQ